MCFETIHGLMWLECEAQAQGSCEADDTSELGKREAGTAQALLTGVCGVKGERTGGDCSCL